MTIQHTSTEFNIAVKKIKSLEAQGFGRFVCVRNAAKLLISQGYTSEHSYKVAEAAYESVIE